MSLSQDIKRLESKIDFLISLVQNEKQPNGHKEFNPVKFTKIATVKEFDEFEESLKDTSIRESYMNHAVNKFKNTTTDVTNRKLVYGIIDTFTNERYLKIFR